MYSRRKQSPYLVAAMLGASLSLIATLLAWVASADPNVNSHTNTPLMLALAAASAAFGIAMVIADYYSPRSRRDRRERQLVMAWLRDINGLPQKTPRNFTALGVILATITGTALGIAFLALFR